MHGPHAMTPESKAPPPVSRRNLGSDVYGILWEWILGQNLQPGQKLSDLHLSEELGVSRTPVREALHRLVQDGIVEYAPNRGFFVARFSAVDIAEIFDLRAALEALACRTVGERRPVSDLERALAKLTQVEAMIAAARTDQERLDASRVFLEIDQGFHRWIIEQSGNQRLIAIVGGLWGQVSVFQRAGTHIPGWMEIAVGQHREIIKRLLGGEIEAAADALAAHILEMKTRVLADIAPHLTASDDASAMEPT
jgi:DNA-binding GntR family transcriptional regulator